MYFIVVEDDPKTNTVIKEIIDTVMFKTNKDYKIRTYTKYCKELKEYIDDQALVKIFILDIELEGKICGIDIAKLIRENDWDSEIIFVTSHDRMFETVYKTVYKVFDFIEKFNNLEKRLTKDIRAKKK